MDKANDRFFRFSYRSSVRCFHYCKPEGAYGTEFQVVETPIIHISDNSQSDRKLCSGLILEKREEELPEWRTAVWSIHLWIDCGYFLGLFRPFPRFGKGCEIHQCWFCLLATRLLPQVEFELISSGVFIDTMSFFCISMLFPDELFSNALSADV